MKKLILIALLAVFITTASSAQTFKIGPNIGIAASDAGDVSDWSIGADAYYMFGNVDSWLNLGPTVGFRNYFIKSEFSEVNDNVGFLPIAGAARAKLFGVLDGGFDIGYALGLTDGVDGGFYFRPNLGVDILDTLELVGSYEFVSSQATWAAINLGLYLEL